MHGDGVCWRQAESEYDGKTLGWVIGHVSGVTWNGGPDGTIILGNT